MDQTIFNIVVAVAGAMGGWILKVIWDAIQDLKNDLKVMDGKLQGDIQDVNYRLHTDFVRRDDFREAMQEIKSDMKSGFSELKDIAGQIFAKLDSKADKVN